MNPNGSFVFTPFPGFAGVDVFEYTVVDGFGNEQIETVTITVNEAKIGSAKSVGDAVPNGDDWDLTFTIVVENLGNVALDNLTVLDDVAAQFGPALVATGTPTITNFNGSGTAPTINSNWLSDTSQNMVTGGRLEAGASFEVTFTITVDPDAAVSASELSNQAMVSGSGINPDATPMTDSNGNLIVATDDSDNGLDPDGENDGEDSVDGIAGNDVTEILIADLGIAKAVVGEPVLTDIGNYVVTYRVVVENTGTVGLAELSLLEDLTSQFGSAFVGAGNLTLATAPSATGSSIDVAAASWNGSTQVELLATTANNVLVTGDSFAIEFDVEIDPREVAGSVANQIEGSGAAVDSAGNPLRDSGGNQLAASDLSDSGTDPSSGNPDDPSDAGTSDDVSLFTPPAVPLGEISGFVFLDENGNGIQDLGEGGIEGVEITLTGQDVFGNSVEQVAFTDASGQYVFSGLNAGTYALQETQPSGFADGLESGNPTWTIGDDVLSNIELGFGETLTAGRFGERLTGASGNPPSFTSITPAFSPLISDLINGFVGGPGPIYSGTPISSNANPLSLDSNREVAGGFVLATEQEVVNCECAAPTDPCGEVAELFVESTIPMDEVVARPAEEDCCPEQKESFGEQIEEKPSSDCLPDMAAATEETSAVESGIDHKECDSPRRPFLKRLTNWLSR